MTVPIESCMRDRYADTLEQIRSWAIQEQNVTGVIIIGSQTRRVDGADRWSDLDLMLVAHDRQRHLEQDGWLERFGRPLAAYTEVTPLSWLDWDWCVKRVLYADGRDIDFSIVPANRLQQGLDVNSAILAMGYLVLYDAEGGRLKNLIAALEPADWPPPRVTSAAELQRDLGDFLHQLIGACKKVKRGEVWVGVSTLNGHLMELLLKLTESYLDLVNPTQSVLAYEGRFLEQRLEPDLAARLARCATHYVADDALAAARHQLDTCQWLATRLAPHLGLDLNQQQFADTASMLDGIIDAD